MNELSIEEKAKAYDEAIERSKNYYSTTDSASDIKLIGLIFPELKESEDEKIKGAAIEFVMQNNSFNYYLGISKEEVIAWLEKQGEHAKFCDSIQVGDKVTRNQDGVLVNLSQLNRVAKKQGEQNQKHFELKAGHWYICHRAYCCRADHFTVKEGERFMCEKDGVVKGFVIKKPEKYFKEVCSPAPMEDEQKPVTHKYNVGATIYYKSFGGIKSMVVANVIDTGDGNPMFEDADGNDVFEKDLILQMHVEEQEPAWSEEDEKTWKELIEEVKDQLACVPATDCRDEEDEKVLKQLNKWLTWLKSLKERYTWKPSNEQLDALETAVSSLQSTALESLYNELKKL